MTLGEKGVDVCICVESDMEEGKHKEKDNVAKS